MSKPYIPPPPPLPKGVLLDVRFAGIPPSVNHAYVNLPRGGRTLSVKGKAYKVEISSTLIRYQQPALMSFRKNKAYGLAICLEMPNIYNAGWPEKTDVRYKKIDVTNRVKLLEDAIYDALGIDDSQGVTVVISKRPSDLEATNVMFWDPEQANLIDVQRWL